MKRVTLPFTVGQWVSFTHTAEATYLRSPALFERRGRRERRVLYGDRLARPYVGVFVGAVYRQEGMYEPGCGPTYRGDLGDSEPEPAHLYDVSQILVYQVRTALAGRIHEVLPEHMTAARRPRAGLPLRGPRLERDRASWLPVLDWVRDEQGRYASAACGSDEGDRNVVYPVGDVLTVATERDVYFDVAHAFPLSAEGAPSLEVENQHRKLHGYPPHPFTPDAPRLVTLRAQDLAR